MCGIIISILASTPVGSTIVAVDIAAYLCFVVAGALKKGSLV
jgi:zinc transport system permease protein